MKNVLLICSAVLFFNACSSSNINSSQKVVIKDNQEEYDDFDRLDKEDERLLNSDNGLLKLKKSCPIN